MKKMRGTKALLFAVTAIVAALLQSVAVAAAFYSYPYDGRHAEVMETGIVLLVLMFGAVLVMLLLATAVFICSSVYVKRRLKVAEESAKNPCDSGRENEEGGK